MCNKINAYQKNLIYVYAKYFLSLLKENFYVMKAERETEKTIEAKEGYFIIYVYFFWAVSRN